MEDRASGVGEPSQVCKPISFVFFYDINLRGDLDKFNGTTMRTQRLKQHFPEGNIRYRAAAADPSPDFPATCRSRGAQENVFRTNCYFAKVKLAVL